MLGERANRLEAQILSGKHGSRCGGYKCEGERALPGEICLVRHRLRRSIGPLRDGQKSAEAIVVGCELDEGPNLSALWNRSSEGLEQMPRKRA